MDGVECLGEMMSSSNDHSSIFLWWCGEKTMMSMHLLVSSWEWEECYCAVVY
jgi:hypothetical protein